jgi:hypothetical protein
MERTTRRRGSDIRIASVNDERSDGNGRRFTSRLNEPESRSVPELLRELSREGGDLVRQEIALARAEMTEKVETFRRSSVSMAIGGALMLGALLLFVLAVNHGLTAILAQAMALEVAVWLAPLILSVVLLGSGWAVFKGGKERIAEEGLTPEATRETLEEDQRWARRKVHEVKEEIRHG